jgi:hypothetical protein
VRIHDAADVVPDIALTDVVDAMDAEGVDAAMDHADVVATDVRRDVPVPIDIPIPMDVPIDVPIDVPRDVPVDVPVDVRPDVPMMDSGVVPGCSTPYVPGGTALGTCMALRVNELQTAGAAGASDEFVEIYNAGSCTVPLTGWTVRYATATGTTSSVRWTGDGGQLAPGGIAVIGGASLPCTNVIATFAGPSGVLAATGGGVGLFDPSGTRVDSVGYGAGSSNPLVEGTAAAAPATSQSIGRGPTGADTNNNATDFVVYPTPTPGLPNH